jgi:hypothetical protein
MGILQETRGRIHPDRRAPGRRHLGAVGARRRGAPDSRRGGSRLHQATPVTYPDRESNESTVKMTSAGKPSARIGTEHAMAASAASGLPGLVGPVRRWRGPAPAAGRVHRSCPLGRQGRGDALDLSTRSSTNCRRPTRCSTGTCRTGRTASRRRGSRCRIGNCFRNRCGRS